MQLQPGIYHGRLIKWGTDQISTGTPLVFLTFSITHVYDAQGQPQEVAEVERDVRLFLSDAAFSYTSDKLKQLGFNGDFGDGMDFHEQAKAEGCQLKCEHSEKDGKTYENWDLNSWGERERKPITGDMIRQLNARFKNAAGAAPKTPASKPPQPAARPTPAGKPLPNAPLKTPPKSAPALTSKPAPAERRDQSWAVWYSGWKVEEKPERQNQCAEMWQAEISKVAHGRDESALTAEDWALIDSASDIPF